MTTSASPSTSTAHPAPAPKKAAPRKAPLQKTAAKRPKAASQPAAGKKTGSRKAATPAKPVKVKKPKLVRDSFTLPKDEYTVLADLKQRCAQLAQPAKKSELLRAGIKALAALSDKSLLAALKAVPPIKTGRPKKA